MLQTTLDFIQTIPSPLTFLLGMFVLLLGGHSLVNGAVAVAARMGLSTLLIGLTIVAFGTSAPELFFNVAAAINGNGDLSFGNVVGSNIANIALVLGLAAIISPLVVHSRVITKEVPLLIVVSIGMLGAAWWNSTSVQQAGARSAFTRIDGLLMLLAFMFFTLLWYRMGKRDRADPLATEAEAVEARHEATSSLPIAIGLFILGLIGLIVGGKLAEIGAVGVAESLKLSKALIGLTIVAIATSLPEVTTSIIACRKGHSDLAVGNVVGSNLFNILLVLGLTAVCAPVPVPADPPLAGLDRGWWDLFVMLGLTVMMLPIAYSNKRRITKPQGAFLLICYIAYLAFSVAREFG